MQNRYSLLVPETLIPNNSDLNDYTTPGQYYSPNLAASQTIEHSPYTVGGFKLSVETTVTQNRIIQILKPGAISNTSVYFRVGINQSGWEFSDWEKSITNADIQGDRYIATSPTPNEDTVYNITFPHAYSATPVVVVSADTAAMGQTVLGVSTSNVSKTGFDLHVLRTNDTNTAVHWIALGK